ncbi:MAG: hypothetical protein LBJ61_01010 [Deltaproteobacteria bacterium]|jgi:Fe-S cluster assembly iron-binding protein IscA|nr:hypothetical protein [Deltaproteobacteria bacterium]
MINVTTEAQTRLGQFLTDNKAPRNVRVFFPSTGCGGVGLLSLTVDEPNAGDFSVTIGDIVYCINRELQEVTGGVKIDFKDTGLDSGFVVDSEKILPVLDPDCGPTCGGCC